WRIGVLMVALAPVTFIALLGYAVAATRSASIDPAPGPPRWALSLRLLSDGFWIAIAVVLIAVPFVLASGPLARVIEQLHLWRVNDLALSSLYANLAAAFVL